MHRLAVIISIALVVDSYCDVRLQCCSPGTHSGSLEQLLCVSDSIRMRSEELAEGGGDRYAERKVALKEDAAQEPPRAEQILQRAREILREGEKAVEEFRIKSRKTSAPKR